MKVLITPRSFGKNNPELFTKLKDRGLELIKNDTGAILSEQAMLERISDVTGLIVGVDPVNKKVLDAAPKLKAIAKYGVGVDNIDLQTCQERQIHISRTVGANSNAVADYTFALMLGLARKVVTINAKCKEHNWQKITTQDVYGKTLGIIGLGNVGKCVAKRAKGFDMRILAYDVYMDKNFTKEHGIIEVDLETLLKESDFVSLHAQLTDTNHKLLNADRLKLMRKTAFLINTARGDLVDEQALLAMLEQGELAGAGLDVFTKEPPSETAWYNLNNVIMGSHCSSSTLGATEKMGYMAANNLLHDLGLAAIDA